MLSVVTKLQGGDPSPGLAEVSTLQVLEVGGAGGVVRDHHVDVSGLQRRPQLLLRDQTTNQPTTALEYGGPGEPKSPWRPMMMNASGIVKDSPAMTDVSLKESRVTSH